MTTSSSSILCRDPSFSLFPCPMLRSGTVTSAHRIAHGAYGGSSHIAVKHVVQPVSLGVLCPCAQCCPCEEHQAMREEIEAEAEPMAEEEDKQRCDAVQALLTADAASEDAFSDAGNQASKRSRTNGKGRRATTGSTAAESATATAFPAAAATTATPASPPSWSPDSPLFAWLAPEAALSLAAWDPRAMEGAPHRPLLDESAGTPPEYAPLFTVSKRPLGSGTFSTVWSVTLKFPPRDLPANASAADRATHAYLKGALALKRFRPITASRIDSELEIAWRFGLMSPHIPPLLSILRLPGYPVSMLMPQCKHQSFHEVVHPRGRWPKRFQNMTLRQIQAYMRGLLHALSVLHEFNIIHRDVKPDNYLFDFEASASEHTGWLVDFGLAHTSSLPHADLRCQQPERAVAVPMEEEAGEDGESTSEPQQSPRTPRTPRTPPARQQQDGLGSPRSGTAADFTGSSVTSNESGGKRDGKVPRARWSANSDDSEIADDPAAGSGEPSAVPTSADPNSSRKKRSRAPLSATTAAAVVDPALSASLSAVSNAALVMHRRPRGPEGGTRGYRAPEVLVASLSQGVGVDVWSAGAMLLEIMSRRSPFFHGEKTTGLVECMALRGVRELFIHGAVSVTSENWTPESHPWTLGEFCEHSSGVRWPPEMERLLDGLLQLDPAQRLSAKAALALPFFQMKFTDDPVDKDCESRDLDCRKRTSQETCAPDSNDETRNSYAADSAHTHFVEAE